MAVLSVGLLVLVLLIPPIDLKRLHELFKPSQEARPSAECFKSSDTFMRISELI